MRDWTPKSSSRAAQVIFLGACAVGVLVMLMFPSSLAARAAALGGMAAAFAVARSLTAGRGKRGAWAGPSASAGTPPRPRPSRWLWGAAGGFTAGAVASYWLLLIDQGHGGRALWPLYLFVGFVVAGAAASSVLAAKLTRW